MTMRWSPIALHPRKASAGGGEGLRANDGLARGVGGVEVDDRDDGEVVVALRVLDGLADAPQSANVVDGQQSRRAACGARVDRVVLVPIGAQRVFPGGGVHCRAPGALVRGRLQAPSASKWSRASSWTRRKSALRTMTRKARA